MNSPSLCVCQTKNSKKWKIFMKNNFKLKNHLRILKQQFLLWERQFLMVIINMNSILSIPKKMIYCRWLIICLFNLHSWNTKQAAVLNENSDVSNLLIQMAAHHQFSQQRIKIVKTYNHSTFQTFQVLKRLKEEK